MNGFILVTRHDGNDKTRVKVDAIHYYETQGGTSKYTVIALDQWSLLVTETCEEIDALIEKEVTG
jgi:hypothetical protein